MRLNPFFQDYLEILSKWLTSIKSLTSELRTEFKLIESPATYFCSGKLSSPTRLFANFVSRILGDFLDSFESAALDLNLFPSEQPGTDGTFTGLTGCELFSWVVSVETYLSVTVSLTMTALLFSPLRIIVSRGSAVWMGVVITAKMEKN